MQYILRMISIVEVKPLQLFSMLPVYMGSGLTMTTHSGATGRCTCVKRGIVYISPCSQSQTKEQARGEGGAAGTLF